MTAIAEKELVQAPLASANPFLQAVLARHTAPKGEGAQILLRAGEATKPAIVTLGGIHRTGDMTPRYVVHWEAEGGGPYPVFDGELTIGADEDYNSFWLVLAGAYAPPGGAAGQVFDAVIGRRIAETSARGLLSELSAEIEQHFAASESAKRK